MRPVKNFIVPGGNVICLTPAGFLARSSNSWATCSCLGSLLR